MSGRPNKWMKLPKRWPVDGEPASRAIIAPLRFAAYPRRWADIGESEMPTLRAIRMAALVVLLLALATSNGFGKLAFRTDDVYVRQATLILVADTVSLLGESVSLLDRTGLAIVRPTAVIFGDLPAGHIRVRNYAHTAEDFPIFTVGSRSLLFLKADAAGPETYSCVGRAGGKRDYVASDSAGWERQLQRVALLVKARQRPSD